MAIGTTNGQLSVIEYGQVWQPNLPMSPAVVDQGVQQQWLWSFPEALWGAILGSAVTFYRGAGRAGVTEHQGVSKPRLALTDNGGGFYTVVKTHPVSDADVNDETFLVDGGIP